MAGTILLVHDDIATIAAVRRLLSRERLDVTLATSAADALIAFGAELPALIILAPSVEGNRGQVVLEELAQHPDAQLARVLLLGESVPGFGVPVVPLPLDGTLFLELVRGQMRGGAHENPNWFAGHEAAAEPPPSVFAASQARGTQASGLEATLFGDSGSEDEMGSALASSELAATLERARAELEPEPVPSMALEEKPGSLLASTTPSVEPEEQGAGLQRALEERRGSEATEDFDRSGVTVTDARAPSDVEGAADGTWGAEPLPADDAERTDPSQPSLPTLEAEAAKRDRVRREETSRLLAETAGRWRGGEPPGAEGEVTRRDEETPRLAREELTRAQRAREDAEAGRRRIAEESVAASRSQRPGREELAESVRRRVDKADFEASSEERGRAGEELAENVRRRVGAVDFEASSEESAQAGETVRRRVAEADFEASSEQKGRAGVKLAETAGRRVAEADVEASSEERGRTGEEPGETVRRRVAEADFGASSGETPRSAEELAEKSRRRPSEPSAAASPLGEARARREAEAARIAHELSEPGLRARDEAQTTRRQVEEESRLVREELAAAAQRAREEAEAATRRAEVEVEARAEAEEARRRAEHSQAQMKVEAEEAHRRAELAQAQMKLEAEAARRAEQALRDEQAELRSQTEALRDEQAQLLAEAQALRDEHAALLAQAEDAREAEQAWREEQATLLAQAEAARETEQALRAEQSQLTADAEERARVQAEELEAQERAAEAARLEAQAAREEADRRRGEVEAALRAKEEAQERTRALARATSDRVARAQEATDELRTEAQALREAAEQERLAKESALESAEQERRLREAEAAEVHAALRARAELAQELAVVRGESEQHALDAAQARAQSESDRLSRAEGELARQEAERLAAQALEASRRSAAELEEAEQRQRTLEARAFDAQSIPAAARVTLEGLAALGLRLHRGRATVRLELKAGDALRVLFVEDGLLHGAASTVASESLLERAHRDGLIDGRQVRELRLLLVHGELELVRAMRERGYLREAEVVPLLQRYTEQIGLEALSEPHSGYRLSWNTKGELIPGAASVRPLPTLITEALRRGLSLETVAERTHGLRAVPHEEVTATDVELGWTEREQRVLAGVDGASTIQSILLGAGVRQDVALRTLAMAQVLGLLRIEPPAPSTLIPQAADLEISRLTAKWQEAEEADYFALLGLGRDAGADEVARAFSNLKDEFNPLRFAGHPDPALQHRAEALQSMLTEAYDVLLDDRLRQSYARNLVD